MDQLCHEVLCRVEKTVRACKECTLIYDMVLHSGQSKCTFYLRVTGLSTQGLLLGPSHRPRHAPSVLHSGNASCRCNSNNLSTAAMHRALSRSKSVPAKQQQIYHLQRKNCVKHETKTRNKQKSMIKLYRRKNVKRESKC